MQYESFKVKLTGVAPLVMHSGQTADPLSPFSMALKEVSGKRKKTEADHREMARIEFMAGLYLNAKGRVIVPGVNLESVVIEGAKKSKRGREAKAGVLIEEDPELIYEGPKDAKALYAEERFHLRVPVKVGQVRIMRTRPQFPVWSLAFTVMYLPDVLNRKEVIEALATAGQLVGLGDWRPRFGRFEVAA